MLYGLEYQPSIYIVLFVNATSPNSKIIIIIIIIIIINCNWDFTRW
jgi:hypothetical protein